MRVHLGGTLRETKVGLSIQCPSPSRYYVYSCAEGSQYLAAIVPTCWPHRRPLGITSCKPPPQPPSTQHRTGHVGSPVDGSMPISPPACLPKELSSALPVSLCTSVSCSPSRARGGSTMKQMSQHAMPNSLLCGSIHAPHCPPTPATAAANDVRGKSWPCARVPILGPPGPPSSGSDGCKRVRCPPAWGGESLHENPNPRAGRCAFRNHTDEAALCGHPLLKFFKRPLWRPSPLPFPSFSLQTFVRNGRCIYGLLLPRVPRLLVAHCQIARRAFEGILSALPL